MSGKTLAILAAFALAPLAGCSDPEGGPSQGPGPERDAGGVEVDASPDAELDLEHPDESVIYDFVNQCVALGLSRGEGEETRWLRVGGEGFAFSAEGPEDASRFFMRASDLGTFLFYDEGRGYLVGEGGALLRHEALKSDITEVDDNFISGAEWRLEFSQRVSRRYQLRSRRTGELLVEAGGAAADLVLEAVEGCVAHPEMSLDASGVVTRTTYDDGDLFGYADTHSHILSNFGFGGGGVIHGAAFHRLGVEHAMGSCEPFHGPDGRADFLSWGVADRSDGVDLEELVSLLSTGLLPDPLHDTDGWPTFSGWPSQSNDTHQTQYYRWLERAWMSGLRLVVQHATSNEVLCSILVDTGFQPARWGCEDMLNVDRQILEARRLEAYIDAQSGGPGEGWFRIVGSPQEAREVIRAGKMAVVLGIEVPNLFDCYLTPRPDDPVCDAAHINAQLDRYFDLGVRVLFPNHKLDNAFTPGDGSKGIMELANFIQTGHWSNFVEDCPEVSAVFDKGSVQFGGFNQPRDEYLSPAPNARVQLTSNPLSDLLPYLGPIMEPPLEGQWCQKGSLTPAGVTLVEGIMARGMVIEVDHLPARSYKDVFDILAEARYPAAATHGNTNGGRLFTELGGLSSSDFARCADPAEPGIMARRFRARRDELVAAGLYPASGFGFDLNGLAGLPGPRFGPDARCEVAQQDPIDYPFMSYAGDVVFQEPHIGERALDFNTEGFLHIGMVPELIEDARRTGVSDEDLDILFRSAEAYLRMWERSLGRSEAMLDE